MLEEGRSAPRGSGQAYRRERERKTNLDESKKLRLIETEPMLQVGLFRLVVKV